MTSPPKYSPREAYEEDCRRCPLHHDGTPRPTWDELDQMLHGESIKSTWVKNPTPREYRHLRAPKKASMRSQRT